MATWSTRYGYTNMTVTATEDTVSTANNTSRVVVNVKLAPAGTQPVYNGFSQTLTVKVNSSTIGTKAFTYNIAVGKSLDLGTYTTTITHNADGSKTVPIVVSASGGGDSASISKSLELTKIARASSITGGWSWTIGNNTTVSISRASSSFTHTVYIDTWNKSTASWGNIRTITGVGTSISSGFVASNIATMAQHLRNESATANSIKTRIRVQTYSGTTAIGGVVTSEGTLTNINASTISSATATAHNGVPYTVTRQSSNGNITHELSYQFGTFNKKLTLANTASNTGTMSFNSTELDTIYKQVTGGLYGVGGFTLTTYIAGVQVKNAVSIDSIRLNFDTAQVAPTINNAFTFSDTNASMVAITGNNQIAIQNKSTINVVVPANASTFKSGATGKTYSVTINGVEKTATYSASATTIAFGTVSAGSNTTIAVSITDSRGIKVSTTKTLTVYPYANPTVSGVMARANGFDDSTTIRATGSIASVSSKNAITSVHYRFKETTASTYGSYAALTATLTGANFSTNTVTHSFDNTKKYHVEFRIIDKVGTTTTKIALLDSGKPIMFVDKKNKSVGIGKFPDFANTLETEGDLRVGFGSGTSVFDGGIHVKGPLYMEGGIQSKYLGDNTDLNNITNPGLYYCNSNAVAGTMKNVPRTMAFSLFVEKHAGFRQTFSHYEATDTITFVRNFYNGSWGGWSVSHAAVSGTSPTLLNGWKNYSDGYSWAHAYRYHNGLVLLRGMLHGGASTHGNILQLPENMRPVNRELFLCQSNYGARRVDMQMNGYLLMTPHGKDDWLSISGIAFMSG